MGIGPSRVMKDMPALLCAVLASRDPQLLRAVFPPVFDDAKVLRSFVQMVASPWARAPSV